MNQIDQVRIQLPSVFADQQSYISDQVRDGLRAQLAERRFKHSLHLPELQLGVIDTHAQSSADDIVQAILTRFEQQLEQAL